MYKRQVEMRALEAHYKVQKQGGFTSLPLEAGNMGPVSYTHLDVYKRQV